MKGKVLNTSNKTPLATILVYAWDTYEPAWPVFCHGLRKYWPDCPFPLVFLTNFAEPPCGTAIKVGNVNHCCPKISMGLAQIMTPYILFMHEDYWIKSTVPTSKIMDYLGILQQNKADYIRLFPNPGPDRAFPEDNRLGIINKDSDYRLSFMASLWRVSVLKSILTPKYGLSQMEKYGNQLTEGFGDRFLSVWNVTDGIDYVATAITERQWTKEAYQYARDEEIKVRFEGLPLPPWMDRLKMLAWREAYFLKKRITKWVGGLSQNSAI